MLQETINKLWARPYEARVFTLQLLKALAELDDRSLSMICRRGPRSRPAPHSPARASPRASASLPPLILGVRVSRSCFAHYLEEHSVPA